MLVHNTYFTLIILVFPLDLISIFCNNLAMHVIQIRFSLILKHGTQVLAKCVCFSIPENMYLLK